MSDKPFTPLTMRNIKTSVKLRIFAIVACVVMIGIGLLGLRGMDQIRTNTGVITQQNLQDVAAIASVHTAIDSLDRDFRQAVIETDETWIQKAHALEASDEQNLNAVLARFNAMPHDGEEQQAIATLDAAIQNWIDTLHTLERLAGLNTPQGDAQVIVLLHSQWLPQSQTLSSAIDQVIAINQQQGAQARAQASDTVAAMTWALAIALILACLLIFGMGAVMARLIGVPLSEMATLAQRIASGDLSADDQQLSRFMGRDEAGQLAGAFAEMIVHLRGLIQQIQSLGVSVLQATTQIGATTDKTQSTVDQVSQTTRQVALGAQQQSGQLSEMVREIDQLSQYSEDLENGAAVTTQSMATLRQTVSLTSDRVRQLGKRSGEIGQIVQTIDEISEQTNLLALNAAIEAARAGEQGRGFAVVADEVRKLAERAGKATKEISAIIRETQHETQQAVEAMEQGVTEVGLGVSRVQQSREQARQIVASTRHVHELVTSVASVSEENGAAAEEVSHATSAVADHVRVNVEAVTQLNAVAGDLRHAIERFSTRRSDGDDQRVSPWDENGFTPLRQRAA